MSTNLICLIRDAKQELEKLCGQPAAFIYMTPAVHDRLRDETFAFKEKDGIGTDFRLKTFMGMKVKIDVTVPDQLGIYLSHVELKLPDMHKRKTDVTA